MGWDLLVAKSPHSLHYSSLGGHCVTGDTAGAEKGGPKAKSWRDEPVEKRLAHALVKGIDEFAVRVRSPLWCPLYFQGGACGSCFHIGRRFDRDTDVEC